MLFCWGITCRLFIYKVRDTLTDNPKDLSLEWQLAVDTSLMFNIGVSWSTVPF